MNEADHFAFERFLQRQKRKPSAIEQIFAYLNEYETYLQNFYPNRVSEQTTIEMLESYVSWYESETKESASKPLWALRYYFDFIENRQLSDLAGDLRAERVKRKPFFIRDFRGVNPDHIARLDGLYIENIDQMIDAARTPRLRQELAAQTGIPLAGILELLRLSDLARLPAVRRVRARLYHDAGLTPETIAAWEPEFLHKMLAEWVVQHQFDGIPPQPKEVENLVDAARHLPPIVIYA